MIDEGVIKFDMRFKQSAQADLGYWQAIEQVRYRLRYLGYVGEYEQYGIGFGNISVRMGNSEEFVITGTQTGKKQRLGRSDFCRVTKVIIDRNYVECEGPIKASSEAMTHAMIYLVEPKVKAIIHVHHNKLWNSLMYNEPTTGADIPYGTTQMATAVRQILQQGQEPFGCIVMAGHEDGIIYYGENLEQALNILMLQHYKLKNN